MPGPEWEIKLVDVPEMGYFVRDNKGEVCVKGPGVFQVLYCIVLYCIVLYCIVLYCIVLYCIVLYCIV